MVLSILNVLAQTTKSDTSNYSTVIAALIAAAAAIIGAFLNYRHNQRMFRETKAANDHTAEHNKKVLAESIAQTDRTVSELRVTERRKQLGAALQEFLEPLYSQLMSMKALSQLFYKNKPKEFRALPYLLDPANYMIDGQPYQIVFSDSDKKLLEEIIEISKQIEQLIILKGGLVDFPELTKAYIPDPKRTDVSAKELEGYGLFAIVIPHFRIFRQAYNGAIHGEVERYSAYVYPRELNEKIYAAIESTRLELNNLSVT